MGGMPAWGAGLLRTLSDNLEARHCGFQGGRVTRVLCGSRFSLAKRALQGSSFAFMLSLNLHMIAFFCTQVRSQCLELLTCAIDFMVRAIFDGTDVRIVSFALTHRCCLQCRQLHVEAFDFRCPLIGLLLQAIPLRPHFVFLLLRLGQTSIEIHSTLNRGT